MLYYECHVEATQQVCERNLLLIILLFFQGTLIQMKYKDLMNETIMVELLFLMFRSRALNMLDT